MSFQPRPNHPYSHAPRLTEGPEIALSTVLSGAGPFEIEIGSGRGGFVFERAEAAPDVRLLAIEIRLKWATIVNDRLVAQGLGGRVRVVNGDARVELSRLRPDASVARFFLHFPDPWWKARHKKRLVMGTTLLGEVARLLVDEGELFVQTDVEERAKLYEEQLATADALEPFGDQPGSPYLADNPYGARSPREHHAIADGLPVWRLRYRRRPRAVRGDGSSASSGLAQDALASGDGAREELRAHLVAAAAAEEGLGAADGDSVDLGDLRERRELVVESGARVGEREQRRVGG